MASGSPQSGQSQPQFFIQAGVRRCVAAREAGRVDIPAVVYAPGQPARLTRLRLDQLHSPKLSVPRDGRYIRNTEYPTQVLGTEPPPIDVEPLGVVGQKRSVPLAQVRLT